MWLACAVSQNDEIQDWICHSTAEATTGNVGVNGYGPHELRFRQKSTMTKVEAIIQVSKLEAVKDALHEIGVEV